MPSEEFAKWTNVYRNARMDGTELMWPSEILVRLFKGNYVPGLSKNYAGKKAVDVGFGEGNNLISHISYLISHISCFVGVTLVWNR